MSAACFTIEMMSAKALWYRNSCARCRFVSVNRCGAVANLSRRAFSDFWDSSPEGRVAKWQ